MGGVLLALVITLDKGQYMATLQSRTSTLKVGNLQISVRKQRICRNLEKLPLIFVDGMYSIAQ